MRTINMAHKSGHDDAPATGMPKPARMGKDIVAERIHGGEPVFVTSADGKTALLIPNDDRNTDNRDHDDGVAVWGCVEYDHPAGGYTRVRAFGDGKPTTVPIRTLARMAYRRALDLLL